MSHAFQTMLLSRDSKGRYSPELQFKLRCKPVPGRSPRIIAMRLPESGAFKLADYPHSDVGNLVARCPTQQAAIESSVAEAEGLF